MPGTIPSALITGASSGIGRALAAVMGRAGYALTLVGRDRGALETVRAELPKGIGRRKTQLILADLSDPARLEELTDELKAAGTAYSAVIHCAGFGVSGRAVDIPLHEHLKCWSVSYLAAVALTRACLPAMSVGGEGSLLFITSGVARRALPFFSPYCAAKAALDAFVESLRVELASTEIKVLLFSPGQVATAFHRSLHHWGPTRVLLPPLRPRDPGQVAERIFRALQRGEVRTELDPRARWVEQLSAISPRLIDRVLSAMFRLEDELV